MKRLIFTVMMMFSFAGIFAQEAEFTADRPGVSTGPSTVAKGVIQWEQGMQLDVVANLDLCDPAHCWAVSFGVAWQVNK